MAKVIDITEKLSMEENPKIKIRDQEFEINAGADTMLRIMGLLNNKPAEEAAIESFELLFGAEDCEKLRKMLLFKDLMVVIQSAIQLVAGGIDAEGEAQTHTTT